MNAMRVLSAEERVVDAAAECLSTLVRRCSMNRQRFALWLLLGGITAVLSAGPAFGTNLAIATNVPAPIATEAGVLRISVGSDITALGGESLRAAARSLVQPLIAAGIQFQTLILVDGSTDTDFQSYAYSDLF